MTHASKKVSFLLALGLMTTSASAITPTGFVKGAFFSTATVGAALFTAVASTLIFVAADDEGLIGTDPIQLLCTGAVASVSVACSAITCILAGKAVESFKEKSEEEKKV